MGREGCHREEQGYLGQRCALVPSWTLGIGSQQLWSQVPRHRGVCSARRPVVRVVLLVQNPAPQALQGVGAQDVFLCERPSLPVSSEEAEQT